MATKDAEVFGEHRCGGVAEKFWNISQIEHTRHRSGFNFLVNIVSALIAYTYQQKKPSLNIRPEDFGDLPAVIV